MRPLSGSLGLGAVGDAYLADLTALVAGCEAGDAVDRALLETCLQFGRSELHAQAAARDVAGRDDAGMAGPAASAPDLDLLLQGRARTLAGHRARALVFCIWDEGELALRATGPAFLEDRLLWALISDLAAVDADD